MLIKRDSPVKALSKPLPTFLIWLSNSPAIIDSTLGAALTSFTIVLYGVANANSSFSQSSTLLTPSTIEVKSTTSFKALLSVFSK